jgi:general secretion pathway protein G
VQPPATMTIVQMTPTRVRIISPRTVIPAIDPPVVFTLRFSEEKKEGQEVSQRGGLQRGVSYPFAYMLAEPAPVSKGIYRPKFSRLPPVPMKSLAMTEISHMAIRPRRTAFTLIELMVVVVIVGVLAAIVVAAYHSMTGDARVSGVMRQLQIVRSEIQIYRFDHNDTWPDLVTNQWNQMLDATDATGAINASGGLGPYMTQMPANPINGNVVVDSTASGPTVGWVYTQSTGAIQATNATPTVLFDETTQTIQ